MKEAVTPNLELRREVIELLTPNSIESSIQSYKIVIDVCMKLMWDLRNYPTATIIEADAEMLFQMTISKCLSVLKLFEGIRYTNDIDPSIHMPHFVYPLPMENIVRSQFEAFCLFNHIFILHNDPHSQELLYNLWVLSGLNYRQEFIKPDMQKENLQKADRERKQIEELKDKIYKSSVFLNLTEKGKEILEKSVNDKKFQLRISGKNISYCGWQKMFTNSGANKEAFSRIYSSMSLKAHPSNVSVFQFRDLFKNGTNIQYALFTINISQIICALMISDLCKFNENAKRIFETLPVKHQALINMFNGSFRGRKFWVNNVLDKI